jgi:NitT/TauT family transport system substrate-binding protein
MTTTENSGQVVIAVPDLVSPSYFPAIAAVDLGFVRDEGVDARLELLFPVTDAAHALREGRIDLLAGAAHAPMHAFPDWRGAKLLLALSRNTYWFLVMRADLGIGRGDLGALHDVRIGAAPGPDLGLRIMFSDAGVDAAAKNIEIGAVPGSAGAGISFGVTAADALAAGKIDGFWANGMGAEVAVRNGTGSIIVDARRDKSPEGVASYTFPALAATDQSIEQRPDMLAAVSRAIRRAQQVLSEEPQRATEVGERLFPPMEAGMISELIRRDAEYYQARIEPAAASSLLDFGRRAGLLNGNGGYQVVAPGFDG